MRDELTHVLGRGHLDRWQPDLALLGAQWDKYCVEVPVPPPASHATRLRCTDADDQKFIDLALRVRRALAAQPRPGRAETGAQGASARG